MATAAGPTMARTTSRRQTAYGAAAADKHQRTPSESLRSPASAGEGNRTEYASPNQQQSLAAVARRDYETTNVARSQPSRRSSSRDPAYAPTSPGQPGQRDDGGRSHHRTDSRSGAPRYSSDIPRTPASAGYNNYQPSSARSKGEMSGAEQAVPVRKRTTITAQTGVWSLGKTVGAGSMGKVKIARNQETGETCAIKIVPRQSTDEHATEKERQRADHSKEIRTAREAAIVTLLNHPYICGMRDVVRTNYHWYMLFEYVNGGQMLDFIISHGRLKEKQARKFGRQIASALDYCHRNSIVHRDLKIENILISKNNDVKIIDFGLSNLFSPRSHLKTFCGSLYFAAPELLNAKQYTGPEVDVWSFGIVLYVLVCGKVPFDDQSMPQLHAKIKKGVVDYPNWLSAECKNLISRMLVTDPRSRMPLSEVMMHPWMTKGFNGPPESHLPHREPLQLPLDPVIIDKMTGFDFGTSEYISRELTRVLESEDYQNAVRLRNRSVADLTPGSEKKKGVFDFYKRRNSISRDTLPNLSAEAVHQGTDPVNAYSPLISIYYLVREKYEREKAEANPGALQMPTSPGEKPLRMPDLPPPEAAYTNSNAYEMPGEKATGGRSRPRARTHGEDDVPDAVKNANTSTGQKSPAIVTTPAPPQSQKKESMAGGLLRRFSTRRGRDYSREPPSLQLQPPNDASGSPRRTFSVRKTRNKESLSPMIHSAGSQPHQSQLLTPPLSTGGAVARAGNKLLGRSTSVNMGEYRRRRGQLDGNEAASPAIGDPPPTSGSDRSSIGGGPRVKISEPPPPEPKSATTPRSTTTTSRTKSLGHARRDSTQVRRLRRGDSRHRDLPEETDVGEETEGEGQGEMKPVFLKGIFSVSTTSTQPLYTIRADIIRVLKQLGVDYTEIKGGFSCRHVPSIDLKSVNDASPASPDRGAFASPSHRRRISFGGFKGGDRDRDEIREMEKSPQQPGRRRGPDQSFTGSDESEEEHRSHRRQADRVAGETTTHVQSDLGENLVLKFEIVIVKVPLVSLHGIQFKKVAGGTWPYKNMAQKILDALRL